MVGFSVLESLAGLPKLPLYLYCPSQQATKPIVFRVYWKSQTAQQYRQINASDARQQSEAVYEYCEPRATKQMMRFRLTKCFRFRKVICTEIEKTALKILLLNGLKELLNRLKQIHWVFSVALFNQAQTGNRLGNIINLLVAIVAILLSNRQDSVCYPKLYAQ